MSKGNLEVQIDDELVEREISDTERDEIVQELIADMSELFQGYIAGGVSFEDLTFEMYDTLRTLTFENGAEIRTGYSTIVGTWTTPDRVVLAHALIGGGEISETFELDGTRLKWDVRVKKDGFKTIRISRVFERAAATPAAQP